MGIIITLIILLIAVMLIFFKNDVSSKETSLTKLSGTSGFVVCVITLVVLYIINR